jgi:hypothetical protein
MQKTGRNDPCPCGSGLKFKKCCLHQESSQTPTLTSTDKSRMRLAQESLQEPLIEHMLSYYGESSFAEAWDEFSGWEDIPMDADKYPELTTVLMLWILYNWVPDNAGMDEDEWLPEMPVAEHYLDALGSRVSEFNRRFVLKVMNEPFSYWQVTNVVAGQTVTLRDLLRDQTVTVIDRVISQGIDTGAVVYARVVSMDDETILMGLAPIALAPNCAQDMIDYRQRLAQAGHPDLKASPDEAPALTIDILFEYEFELRSYYWQARQMVLNPTPPTLQNTDGELLVPTKLIYRLSCTPTKAFDALASLSLNKKSELLQNATFNKQGLFESIAFPWQKAGNKQNKAWDNTVLGEIFIHGQSLTVEVNSKERATSIKRRIAQRLKGQATFVREETETVHDMIERKQADTHSHTHESLQPSREDTDALMALPEVQEQLRRLTEQYWHDWLDTELPALKGQTPRQASKTPIGRKRLEALLTDFAGKCSDDPTMDPDIDQLRRELGLN